MGDDGGLIETAAVLEKQPHALETLVVERVGERVRPGDRRTVLEEDSEAVRTLGLGRVVERLAVVRIRTGLEKHVRELRIVHNARGAIKRGHPPVLADVEGIRVSAPCEELARELDRREARAADVDERRPAARSAGGVRVAVPCAPEHEPRPRIALDLRPSPEHPCRAGAAAVRRRGHECVGARLDGGNECAPARVTVLTCDGKLGARENRLAAAQPRERLRIAGSRTLEELLRLLPELLDVHDDLPPERPDVRGSGPEKRSCFDFERHLDEVGTALPADRLRPRAQATS